MYFTQEISNIEEQFSFVLSIAPYFSLQHILYDIYMECTKIHGPEIKIGTLSIM